MVLKRSVLVLFVDERAVIPQDYTSAYVFGVTPDRSLLEEQNKQLMLELEERVIKVSKSLHESPQIDYDIATRFEMALIYKLLEQQTITTIFISSLTEKELISYDLFMNELIGETGIPVWIIPHGFRYHTIGRIIYTTDFNMEDIPTLTRLTGIARLFDSHITALHFTTSRSFDERVRQRGFQKIIQDRVKYDKIDLVVINSYDRIKDIINNYASEMKADLVVMLKKNRNFLKKIFNEDKTRKMAFESEFPLLIFHYHSG